jgi:Tol biopolymer transport system component
MLFGRQDAADWIELQVASNNRILVLSALPLIGKTSFLRHVGALQSMPAHNLLVSLADLPIAQMSRTDHPSSQQEQTISSVLQVVTRQLQPQLKFVDSIDVGQEAASFQAASTLRSFFRRIDPHLAPHERLVLYIDDLHLLVTNNMALVASFLTALMPLLDECPKLYLVFAINQDKLRRIRHPLLDGAPTFNLGTLPVDASMNMITLPVKDILRFDYGITKRIAETNSHHPYYLCLYCHTLLNRQAHDGWVNQQDFDNALNEILNSPIEPFRQIWDQSSWAERGVLAGMAAIQGAHGPITTQEITRFLQRQYPAVVSDVVLKALQTLADRGVLIPMGAVSYRFHVELFRFWLRAHTEPTEILAEVDWHRTAAEFRIKGNRLATRPISPGAPTLTPQKRSKKRVPWALVAGVLTTFVCLSIMAAGIAAAQLLGMGLILPFLGQLTPTPGSLAFGNEMANNGQTHDIAPLSDAVTATPLQLAGPTPTPTPTPALVIARSLPSITYMGRGIDENWTIYVMNADGSGVKALSPGGGDDTAPIWSPDGQKIVFVSRRDGNREIYVMDSDGQNLANITRHPADDWTPAWSPDGSRLAFSSFREGSWEIFVMDTSCLSEPATCPDYVTQITSDGNGNLSPVWSPDGNRFAFNSKANGNWDIYTMTPSGGDIRQVTDHPENDLAPAWSPDGAQLAFESNRDGNVEIYVVNANGGEPRNITNFPFANDHGPTWSPDGKQLVFYSNREGNWDIFTTTLDGATVINLTETPTRDEQTPAWRP